MDIQKKIFWAAAGLVVSLAAMQFLLPHEQPKNQLAQLRIGAGDDITGYLTEQILQGTNVSSEKIEGYEFKDC